MSDVIAAGVGALFGGVLVAIVNNLFGRGVSRATEVKLLAEAERAKAEADAVRSDLTKQEKTIERIRFLVTHLISKHEYFFLAAIGNQTDYAFDDNFRDKDHLRRLWDLGLIEKANNLPNIADLQKGSRLHEYFVITPPGQTYLSLRADSETLGGELSD